MSFDYSTCLSSIISISFHYFLPYFPYHFTFHPYFPYHFTIFAVFSNSFHYSTYLSFIISIMTGWLAIIITQHKIKTRRPPITIDKRDIMAQRLAINIDWHYDIRLANTLEQHNIMTQRIAITTEQQYIMTSCYIIQTLWNYYFTCDKKP